MTSAQILTVAQMQAAEQSLIDAGTSVETLMQVAGNGAAEWVWRIAAGRSVVILCGPGNNGGDGYVIAECLRARGLAVQVVAPLGPKTEAAKAARLAYKGETLTSGKGAKGDVLVDCLFGSGLARALEAEHALVLRDLASRAQSLIAVDLPSGVESDSGALLNEGLPDYDCTLALGAWKYAHWRLPSRSKMGALKLVEIGVEEVEGAAQLLAKPKLSAPALDAHKYSRGLCAVVGGAMPGASLLSAKAAMLGGAGYVKLLVDHAPASAPAALVVDTDPLEGALSDKRISSVLVGPGLGRDSDAQNRLRAVLAGPRPTVLDADALMLLRPEMLEKGAQVLATPHDGELEQLSRTFSVIAEERQARAHTLAKVSGMVICAKGPDTILAAPDGRIFIAPPASPWLSTAGTGDVLAGIAASRMATGKDAFTAACEAVWLHGEVARLASPNFTADDLAIRVREAYAAAL
ncbi:NAD(P)H-hydrate dehydratase [Altererythrobacter lutimaris]|uniref:Bifunctional NAD(P)H-hydrate repair enzyme n=1 Tax=Altererythrobacter lutimaris TaxID=2743979 RepID=A0A850H430_9SPHN|nr:NAD(P)H-hydrate dehydratase [Altererythrobacter lutimaris]NVE93917.1 NAD(P)H-hydrate dehydratase [Altererythrobacter lutimaris]